MVVTSAGDVRASGKRQARARNAEKLTRVDRAARRKDARVSAPLEAHAEFTPYASRDPVGLLLEQAESRVPELLPVRNGRMLVSPFAFAIADFTETYADQNERDYAAYQAAVKDGRVEATTKI